MNGLQNYYMYNYYISKLLYVQENCPGCWHLCLSFVLNEINLFTQ